jgi:hypothetical protein
MRAAFSPAESLLAFTSLRLPDLAETDLSI